MPQQNLYTVMWRRIKCIPGLFPILDSPFAVLYKLEHYFRFDVYSRLSFSIRRGTARRRKTFCLIWCVFTILIQRLRTASYRFVVHTDTKFQTSVDKEASRTHTQRAIEIKVSGDAVQYGETIYCFVYIENLFAKFFFHHFSYCVCSFRRLVLSFFLFRLFFSWFFWQWDDIRRARKVNETRRRIAYFSFIGAQPLEFCKSSTCWHKNVPFRTTLTTL